MRLHFVLLSLSLAVVSVTAADAPAKKAEPVIATFFIRNVQAIQCVDNLNNSAARVPGFVQMRMVYSDDYGLVWFDPQVATHHQIADAIAQAPPVRGGAFVAFLKVTIPEYAEPANRRRVDAVLVKFADRARLELVDAAKGVFELHFKPLAAEPGAKGPLGLRLDEFRDAIAAPAPRGLGLKFEVFDATQPRPVAPPVK